MIVFRGIAREVEKLFNSVSNRSSYIKNVSLFERTPLELMKLLEMNSYNEGSLILHWSGKPLAILDSVQDYYLFPELFSMILAKDFNEVSKIIGVNEINILRQRYKTPDNLIDIIRHRMLNDTAAGSDGVPKYQKMWFGSHGVTVSNDDFRYALKFMSLCSTGQLSAEDFPNFWDRSFMRDVLRTKINFSSAKRLTRQEIRKLIICTISGYSGIDYTNKLR